MANEDSRENSVVGSAIKIAAVGATIYGGYRGGRGLVKHYDDLGATFLGGVGKKMSSKIDDGISAFNKSDGTNAIREGLDKTQEKILQTDFNKQLKKVDKMYNNVGLELSDKSVIDSHNEYNKYNRGEKRKHLKGVDKGRDAIGQNFTDSEHKNMKDFLINDKEMSSHVDKAFNKDLLDVKGTRNLDVKGNQTKAAEQVAEEAKANTRPL